LESADVFWLRRSLLWILSKKIGQLIDAMVLIFYVGGQVLLARSQRKWLCQTPLTAQARISVRIIQ
jgi:hypothetical protein